MSSLMRVSFYCVLYLGPPLWEVLLHGGCVFARYIGGRGGGKATNHWP